MTSSKEDAYEVIEPIRKDGHGATDTGPRDLQVDRQNPDILTSPSTDRGTVPNLKWSFSLSHNRLSAGGWARETTIREAARLGDHGRGEHALETRRDSGAPLAQAGRVGLHDQRSVSNYVHQPPRSEFHR